MNFQLGFADFVQFLYSTSNVFYELVIKNR